MSGDQIAGIALPLAAVLALPAGAAQMGCPSFPRSRKSVERSRQRMHEHHRNVP